MPVRSVRVLRADRAVAAAQSFVSSFVPEPLRRESIGPRKITEFDYEPGPYDFQTVLVPGQQYTVRRRARDDSVAQRAKPHAYAEP